MSIISKVYDILKDIEDPVTKEKLVNLGLIRDVSVENGVLSLKLIASTEKELEKFERQIRERLKTIGEIKDIVIHKEMKKIEPPKLRREPKRGAGKRKVEGVKHVIAVASGKGGVGKSTVAANLALALESLGYKVGLFDGDIYGPSIAKMFGIEGLAPRVENEKMIPIERFGIKILSMGLLLDEQTPVIWRGPLVHKAYEQFFFDANWQGLDFLIVDFPPGTGDAQISASQLVDMSGGIAVTTPQDVSLADVRRAINMFIKMGIKILGVVENMSFFICPNCGHKTYIFGEGGAKKLELEMGVPVIGEIPVDPDVSTSGDLGMPVFLSRPDSPTTQAFKNIAEEIIKKLEA